MLLLTVKRAESGLKTRNILRLECYCPSKVDVLRILDEFLVPPKDRRCF